jgi:hypothetical protein
VPRPDDDQLVWIEFALTFDGYAEKGDFGACAAFANGVRARWLATDVLPENVSDLRTVLFFEQRRWRWSNEEPFTDDEWRYWRALGEAILRLLPSDGGQPTRHS